MTKPMITIAALTLVGGCAHIDRLQAAADAYCEEQAEKAPEEPAPEPDVSVEDVTKDEPEPAEEPSR